MFKEMQTWIQNIISNMKLTEYSVGTVTQLNPVKISLGEGKVITDVESNILYTEQVLEKKLELDSTIVLTEGIESGDKLLMLRVASGQKWIILSKLRDKSKVSIDVNNNWNWS